MENWEETNWWKYLDDPLRDLIRQSLDLIRNETQDRAAKKPYHDYSFIVFSAAKAYEGFLKRMFLDLGLINNQQYYGDNFRIGRALSPTLPKRYRIGWVYGRLANYCGGDELPMQLWDVWKRARNRVFHFFPQHQECINLEEATGLVKDITDVMGRALDGCGVSQRE